MAAAACGHYVSVAVASDLRCALTLDFEDWFHLAYLERSACDARVTVIDELAPFVEQLHQRGIRFTAFVVGAIAERHAKLLTNWVKQGHEIGVHSWDHELLDTKAQPCFLAELSRARSVIEAVSGAAVIGFRAPCFRLTHHQLRLLAGLGFRYDSSVVRSGHRARGSPSLRGFQQVASLVHQRGDFYELELPTVQLFGAGVPIGGGGLFRLLPGAVSNFLFGRYVARGNDNFAFVVHPYELCDRPVPLPRSTSRLSRFRFAAGRRGNVKKVLRFVDACLARGCRFLTCRELIEEAARTRLL